MQQEIWKTYENDDLHPSQKFEISNIGRVRSLNGDKPKILKGYVNNGYLTFSTRKKNKKRTLTYVHKAVAELFLENDDPSKNKVAHLDYDKLNNCVENLQWMTPKENEQHAYKNPAGSKYDKIMEYWDNAHPRDRFFANKLTESKVLKIKRMLNDPNRKTRIKMIAKQFDVSVYTIFSIQAGRSWAWLTEESIKNSSETKLGEQFMQKLKNHGSK